MENRRDFVKKTLTAAVGCCCLGTTSLLSSCTTVTYLTATTNNNMLSVDKKDLLDQKFVVVNNSTIPAPLYLKKETEEKYSAFLMLCTHKGCTVNPAGSILVCPCHGSEFSSAGKVLRGPAASSLKEYPVTVTDTTVLINIA